MERAIEILQEELEYRRTYRCEHFLEDELTEIAFDNTTKEIEEAILRLSEGKTDKIESAALPLHDVSASLLSDKDYWKIRCQLSEAIEAENPCDPDITSGQIKAYEDYHKFINHYGMRANG